MPDQGRLFVGRAQELAALKDAIARPEGQLILAVGGIGSGKTALLEELNAELADDEPCFGLLYRLNRNDTSEAFLSRLMADLLSISGLTKHRLVLNAPRQVKRWKTLAQLVPGTGKAISDLIPEERRPIRERFLEFLHAAAGKLEDPQRLVLIFDPDEYLDESVETDWVSLAPNLLAQTTIVFAQRLDDCPARSAGLRRAANVFRIPDGLTHLSREESDDLVATRWEEHSAWKQLGDAARRALQQELWSKYEGYALPLTMALRDLPHEPASADQLLEASRALPRDYAEILRDRYDDAVETGENATRVLHGLAILESPATCERLAALYSDHGCQAAPLVSACRRDEVARCLTLREGGVVEFFHATMGECVLAQMSQEARFELHRRAAALYERDLEKGRSDREALDRYPYHAYYAGDASAFLDAVSRVTVEKHRLRLLRSCLRDLESAIPVIESGVRAGASSSRLQLAAALNDQAAVLGDLGAKAKAERTFRRVVAMCRQGMRKDPESYRPLLAKALGNLANILTELDRPKEALSAYKEAVSFLDDLLPADCETVGPQLARIVANMSAALRRDGLSERACHYGRRAVKLYRDLQTQAPARFDADLADALNNLGNALLDADRLADSLACHEEALCIRRRLADAQPSASEQDLAMTYMNLGYLYRRMDRVVDGLQASKQALNIFQRLAQVEPAAFAPRVGMVHDNIGNLLLAGDDSAGARLAYDAALRTLTASVKREAAAYLADLEKAVHNATRLLERTGETAEQWPALVEAVQLLAQLSPAADDDKQDES